MAIKKGYYLVNINLFNKRAHSIQILKTVEAINKYSNIELTIIAPKYSNKSLESLFQYHGIKYKFNIIFLNNFLFTNGGRNSFLFFLIPVFLNIFKNRNKIDFIYFRSEYFFLLYYLLFFNKKIKLFYEIHRKGLSRNQNLIKEKIASKVNGVICITTGLKKYYSRFNNNIIVAHDAVDLERFYFTLSKFDARKKIELIKHQKIAMYVGSVTVEKGIDTILKSSELLPNINFYLLGKNSEKIKKMVLNKHNIKAIGQIDNKLIPLYLKSADVLLIPHHPSIKFQSPMKLFEYLASNRFIIASNLENIKEVIDEDDALLYKHDDINDFVEKITNFFDNMDYYENKLKHRKNKIKNFTWENRGKNISCLIEESF